MEVVKRFKKGKNILLIVFSEGKGRKKDFGEVVKK
jgi:hypothetical protein